ncbi:hypothetical protein [Pseudomonas abietaniphila]|uniref:Uncharacterized protein n=1 Tax=Pseudomonas abietaniphila TaxID=89065 RepID=A0A1G8SEG9_9PSED|nr:hypothetical protein [Pseudomonas abietaniphila]SDJ27591.1 hypothetical protein SAMN05216605_12517 [Pseudomonas abietaniphila]
MATITHKYNLAVANQIAGNDQEIADWLQGATFAEASTGHWLAWHGDLPDRIAVLSPDSVPGENRYWMYPEDGESVDIAIARVESGEFDETEVSELNIHICGSTDSPLLPLKDYSDIAVARAYLQGFVHGNVDFGEPHQALGRLELIYERFGQGELKELFAQAAVAYSNYALRVTADLGPKAGQ